MTIEGDLELEVYLSFSEGGLTGLNFIGPFLLGSAVDWEWID